MNASFTKGFANKQLAGNRVPIVGKIQTLRTVLKFEGSISAEHADGFMNFLVLCCNCDKDPMAACEEAFGSGAGPSVEAIAWHDASEQLPDSDIDVLVRTDDDSYSVWAGYHDGHCWYLASGKSPRQVYHWAEMPNGPEVAS
mgnify:CR=1 FL=1|tara:strand:- start:378 stop:803 length:426 start_codon:yes stop_codon:yes gene_type:complete